MNKKIWDLYAPIYEKAMRMDQKYYAYMYKRISRRVVDKEVLEIATGPDTIWRREIFLQGKEKADDTGSNA